MKFLEENTCYQCHDGSVTTLDLKTEFLTKTYRHPVATTPSVHDASESPNSSQFAMPETSASTPRTSISRARSSGSLVTMRSVSSASSAT